MPFFKGLKISTRVQDTMRHFSNYLIIIWVLLSLTEPALAADDVFYLESFENGHINWSTGEVQVIGIGAPVEKNTRESPAADAIILSLARDTAKQNLIELLKTVGIDSQKRVSQMVASSKLLQAQLGEMVYNAKELEDQRKYMTDGTVAVTLTFSLYGGFAQLILPQEIKQIQPITQVIPNTKPQNPPPASGSAEVTYTGLVVDARSIRLQPVLAPRILNENGQEIYGATVISREFAVQHGISRYVIDIESTDIVARIGRRPLVVKGLRTEPPANCDIVISNADVAKLRRSSKHLSLLKECRVVILLNAPS